MKLVRLTIAAMEAALAVYMFFKERAQRNNEEVRKDDLQVDLSTQTLEHKRRKRR